MNWTLALPQIELSLAGMAVLIFGVMRKRNSAVICTALIVIAFLVAAILAVSSGFGNGFNGQVVAGPFSVLMQVLILSGTALALVLSLDYNPRHGIATFEFPVLMAFAVVGMMVMVSASSLLSLYVGLELHTLALCVLAAFDRNNVRSSEAGLKYFILSALATGIMLYGISLVYGFSGTIDFVPLRQTLAEPHANDMGLEVGIVLTLIGLAFKVSAAPFHMWTPDVYEGSPTPVSAVFATTPKVAAMALLVRTMLVPFGHLAVAWQLPVELMAIASMVIGTFGAIGQANIKRLMAYSSIGHMGYALIGLAVATPEGIRGTIIYLVVYVFMSIGAFACIVAMRRGVSALEKIDDLAGLSRRDPSLALLFAIFMFSQAGVPPVAGFFAKLYVFLAAVRADMWILAVVGVLTSVVGAFYYLRVVKIMYFDSASEPFEPRSHAVSLVVAITGLVTLLFSLFLNSLVRVAQSAAHGLFS